MSERKRNLNSRPEDVSNLSEGALARKEIIESKDLNENKLDIIEAEKVEYTEVKEEENPKEEMKEKSKEEAPDIDEDKKEDNPKNNLSFLSSLFGSSPSSGSPPAANQKKGIENLFNIGADSETVFLAGLTILLLEEGCRDPVLLCVLGYLLLG